MATTDPDVVVVWTVGLEDAELSAERLWAAGAVALEWRDEADAVTLIAGYPTPAACHAVAAELGATALEITDDRWRHAWKEHAGAIEVAPGLIVAPAWRPVPAGRLVLQIDPGPCFGSGSHPSTRLLLAALAADPPVGRTVLDVGTGSGILAVAAARLGAARVVAVDIDPAAVEVTAANAARNGVRAAVEASTAPVASISGSFDLLLVNVTAGVHAGLGRHVARLAAPGATLLLSGLLPGQWRHVADAYPGCAVTARPDLDGWEGVVLVR